MTAHATLSLAALCGALSLTFPSLRPATAAAEDNAGPVVAAALERSGGARTVRAPGRVVSDEARVYRVNAGVAGSIRDVSPAVTGSRVTRGQVLATFCSPDALWELQLFVAHTHPHQRPRGAELDAEASEAADAAWDAARRNSSLYKANLQQRTMELENVGVPAVQRDAIAREGQVPDTIQVVAPASGFVLARNVSPGLKFDRGLELYRIADLSRVWVVADVFPQDARLVRRGLRAQVTLAEQGLALPATVTEILPSFDAASRTLAVRLEVDNPGYVLRPDMLVDVALPVELPAAIVVPARAVVDSGLAKTVFVRRADGALEPRRVETGWRHGDRVGIVEGLAPGERVAASGAFLVDSESRLRPPPAGRTPDTLGRRPPGEGRPQRSGGAFGAGASPSASAASGGRSP